MADHVKQHYVPQFYFRNFARDERVCAYNLDSEEGYPPTPISNICYQNHFYGDAEAEEQLSRVESEMATVVHQIVDQSSLEPVRADFQSQFYLDLFVTYTHSRTKAAREEASALTQEMLEMMTEVGVETGELDQDVLEKVRNEEIRLEGPDHELYQLLSLYGPILVADLGRVLVWNATNRNFITSDHPVVLDNSRFKDEIELATQGLTCAGLQVFCPLSHNVSLLYFDPYAYQVDANSEHTVILKDESVVADLNKLQLLNSLENCYYREEFEASWVDDLYQEVKDDRSEELIRREHERVYDEEQDREREFVRTHHPELEFTPDLPFVTELPTARFTPVRDPELSDLAEELFEESIESAREDIGDEKNAE